MWLENYEQLSQSVQEAKMVLVGLGEEWIVTEDMILADLAGKNNILRNLFQAAQNEERFQNVLPILMACYYKNYIPDRIKMAYENLRELLNEKNYFIVSLTVDPYLEKMGFKEDRYVNPCGNYGILQCENGCQTELLSSDDLLGEVERLLTEVDEEECDTEKTKCLLELCENVMKKYDCKQCGSELRFNLLDTKEYREEGYLERWKCYMKWLQGTLNKELCVIEAGAGVKLPSVIRWPFEKTVFYNQKAKMFRIHKMFYQVNEEVAERAYGCRCHSVELFSERNVEA